ncbi:MAG: hypothetical protein HYX87_07065 [Chloroflexi bacterium]|nr:hypothetical protein [Chloroflexota bacterium]
MDAKTAAIAAVTAYLQMEAEGRQVRAVPPLPVTSTWRLLGRIEQMRARGLPITRGRTCLTNSTSGDDAIIRRL